MHYKDKLKFWSGVELGRRLVFFLALVPFPRNTVSSAYLWLISIRYLEVLNLQNLRLLVIFSFIVWVFTRARKRAR